MTETATAHGVSTVQPVVMSSHTYPKLKEFQWLDPKKVTHPYTEFPDCQWGENENSGSDENIDFWPEETPFE